MINESNTLGYGFFPIASGILLEDQSTFKKCKVLLIGNDFGSKTYLKKCKEKNKRESSKNSTIKTLLSKFKLDPETTFFSNLYLGIRDSESNTKRNKPLTETYKRLCIKYALAQIEILKPKYIFCMGSDARSGLGNYRDRLNQWKSKSLTYNKMVEDKIDVIQDQETKVTYIYINHSSCGLPYYSTNYKLISRIYNFS